MQTGAVQGFQN